MPESRNAGQLIWGIALVLMGLALFFRAPQLMPRIESIEQFSSVSVFIRFCLYFVGIFLIGGGAKKIHSNWGRADDPPSGK
jgi:hypothetical protein